MEAKTWRVDGSRVASDMTGEAMIPLRNIGSFPVVMQKGTALARMLIEDRPTKAGASAEHDRNTPHGPPPRVEMSDFATANWINSCPKQFFRSNLTTHGKNPKVVQLLRQSLQTIAQKQWSHYPPNSNAGPTVVQHLSKSFQTCVQTPSTKFTSCKDSFVGLSVFLWK